MLRRLVLFAFMFSLLSPAAQAALETSIGLGCSMYRGTALNITLKGQSFNMNLSVWGDGLVSLRREKQAALDASLPNNQTGRAEICVKGRSCESIKARLELSSGGIMSNGPFNGRVYWYEPKLDKEVSLPVIGTVTPNTEPCY